MVAAGAGARLGAAEPKAFVPLAGSPIVRWAMDQALACPDVDRVIVMVPGELVARAQGLIGDRERHRVQVVPGGAERANSVRRGLAHLTEHDGVVLVHDAARCLPPPSLFSDVVRAIRAGHGAVVPGLAVADTIKEVDEAGKVVSTLDRSRLRAIQTPQGFVTEILVHAHAEHQARGHLGTPVTDDAGLVEASGAPVLVIPGHPLAEKITTARDLLVAEATVAALPDRPLP